MDVTLCSFLALAVVLQPNPLEGEEHLKICDQVRTQEEAVVDKEIISPSKVNPAEAVEENSEESGPCKDAPFTLKTEEIWDKSTVPSLGLTEIESKTLEQPDQGCGGVPSPEGFQAPSLEVYKARLEGVLSNLVQWKVSLPMAGGRKIILQEVLGREVGRKAICLSNFLQNTLTRELSTSNCALETEIKQGGPGQVSLTPGLITLALKGLSKPFQTSCHQFLAQLDQSHALRYHQGIKHIFKSIQNTPSRSSVSMRGFIFRYGFETPAINIP
ncbi:hypothetical protein HGM15179_006494 [Zosterops borbonicus]|uniref:Uncharacterized protein n=1 Tax=Zosterops borbonicus TaxID=364589 RepID=A0A8K1LNS9_9PASS|nr:hypothetical protein HGM15179_006494 [Zosterops borbonicus]